jgi:fructose-1,6-bisphosphatase/inositol monophosphatase family enzyme
MIEEKIVEQAIYESAKFLKRDFKEITFLHDVKKKKEYFERSYEKNFERIQQILLQFNFTCGVMDEKQNIIKESKNTLYWVIKPIDDETNFSSNLPFWGICVILISKQDESTKTESIAYYAPMLDQFMFSKNAKDFLYKNKKINLVNSTKNDVQFGQVNCNRNLGCDLFHIFCLATESADLIVVQDNFLNRCILDLLAAQIKAKMITKNNKIYVGNSASTSSI